MMTPSHSADPSIAALGFGLALLCACGGEESVTVQPVEPVVPQPNRAPVVVSAIGAGIEDPPVSWGEDLHWWRTVVGNAAYGCEDFESSSLAVLDVLADSVPPASVHALTSGGTEVTGSNGHRTTLCDSAVAYSLGTDVQHPAPRPSECGKAGSPA